MPLEIFLQTAPYLESARPDLDPAVVLGLVAVGVVAYFAVSRISAFVRHYRRVNLPQPYPPPHNLNDNTRCEEGLSGISRLPVQPAPDRTHRFQN